MRLLLGVCRQLGPCELDPFLKKILFTYACFFLQEDSPITEHRKLFPHCPFVRGLEVGNIPISRPPQRSRQSHDSPRAPFAAQASMAAADVVGGYDVCGIRRGIRDANSGPEKGKQFVNFSLFLLVKEIT